MGNLFKHLAEETEKAKQEIAAREKAQRDAASALRSQATGSPLSHTAKTAYVQAYCSATGAPLLFVCEYSPNGSRDWLATEIIISTQDVADKISANQTLYGKAQIKAGIKIGVVCPSCRRRFRGYIFQGEKVECSAWVCSECGTNNCFGSAVSEGGQVVVRCGKCKSEGVMGGTRFDGTDDAITESARHSAPAGTRSAGSVATPSRTVLHPNAGKKALR